MNDTFAGKHKCNPKSHERPFIIEWDATDMSQFEAITSSDVVFVRYEGCDLKVIDSCRNDAVRGSFGSYRAIDWTSGSVEKIDIENEAELYAKLPLGVASLGARVNAGEAFHMEYFVAGTRIATRPAVYRRDLDKTPGCRGATHFVYAVNLGAFALGSKKNVNAEGGVTVWGVGAGGSSKSAQAAEKRGGLLANCRGESAKEIEGCKVPIRLTLREIEEGENPDAKAALADDSPSAQNLAGKIERERKREGKAGQLASTAIDRMRARDGGGCLETLNAYDKLVEGTAQSTNPKAPLADTRARCLMLAGQCDAGKLLLRKNTEAFSTAGTPAEQLDKSVMSVATQNCQGGNLSPDLQLAQAQAKFATVGDAASCLSAYQVARKHMALLQTQTKALSVLQGAVGCLRRVKACRDAYRVGKEMSALDGEERGFKAKPSHFASNYMDRAVTCSAADAGATTPEEQLQLVDRELNERSFSKQTSAVCQGLADAGAKALDALKNEDERAGISRSIAEASAKCLVRAGDCSAAWKTYQALRGRAPRPRKEAELRKDYDWFAGECKGK
jgi:hypothetical protein